MEEDKHKAADVSEAEDHGGGASPANPPSDDAGLVPRDGSTETEGSSALDNSGHGVAPEVAKNDEDVEEPSPESEGVTAVGSGGVGNGASSGGAMDEHLEIPKNPMATRFAFRATDANATTYRRMLSRSKKNAGPTRFVAAADSATGSPEDFSAVPDGDSPGGEKKEDLEVSENQIEARFVSGHTAAKAIPPSTFRIRPTRSRKQSSPTRSIVREAAPPPPAPAAAEASSSRRDSSRSRKKRRPDRFIPEEGEVAARAKARRSGIALDRFITSQINSPSGPRNEWERDVTAADVGGGGPRERDDQHCCFSIPVSDEPGEPAEPADDRVTIYSVLAVLGASLALTMLACILFYIIGMENPPSDQNQE